MSPEQPPLHCKVCDRINFQLYPDGPALQSSRGTMSWAFVATCASCGSDARIAAVNQPNEIVITGATNG